MNSGKARDERVDFLKGFGILCVIAGHLNCAFWLKSFIYLFHMPLFFMISGYHFDQKSSLVMFVRKKVATVLYPYFTFGCLYIAFEWLLAFIQGQTCGISFLIKKLTALLYGNYIFENNADYLGVLWFLVCLFYASVLYRCIKEIVNGRRSQLLTSVALAIVGSVLGRITYANGIRLPWCLDIVPMAVGGASNRGRIPLLEW